ncbi:hypothetical protein BMS3Abin16_01301 [archaeon BMS3Abin16]|nr:hypothetical protein BMS3Abin16_01301 [archaeon BMS3Abin16]HDZ62500.1 hypothetical protein [Nitrospirota bacterium]
MRMALALLFLLLFSMAYNSPILLYPLFPSLNPCTTADVISSTGRMLFIADLHIRDLEKPDPAFKEVGGFARKEGIPDIVVAGDFFNRPEAFYALQREGGPFTAMRDALGLADERLFVIIGSPVHDPQDIKAGIHGKVAVLGRCAVFDINGTRIVAYHGDHMSRHGSIGFAVSYVTRRLFLERTWKALAGIDKDVTVITGHTHVSGVNEKARAANPGGWKKIPLFKPPLGRGIMVDEKGVKQVDIVSL